MRKTKRFIFLFALSLFLSSCVPAFTAADSASKIFTQGNSEYQKGNYGSAEQHYRQILNSGVDSGPLYYNLGNACYKQKRLGEAIYYWEKALQKLPGDREIRENLELANLLIVDRIETPANPLPLEFLARVSGLLTISQESRIVLVLFVTANVLFSIYLLVKKSRMSSRALSGCLAAGILFLIFTGSLSWKIYEQNYRKKGIVIEQKVDVRSGPGAENIAVFTIHEGIKVRVHESSNGWCQISLPNGWSGWMKKDYLRIL